MMNLLHEWEIRSEAINEGFSEGRNEGFNEGRNEGRNEMLRNVLDYMRSEGMNVEQINKLRDTLSKT